MKRFGNLYDKICDQANLYAAYIKAREGKVNSYGVRFFERGFEKNMKNIHAELIFRGKDYDPRTFTRSSPAAIVCKMVNSKGDSISSIGLAYSKAKEGVACYVTDPGDYFVVTAPFGFKPSTHVFMNLWKAKAITVEASEDFYIIPTFKSLYSTGYVEWDE